MRRAALLLLLFFAALPRRADGADRTLRGRIVDRDGHGVAAVEVATAWTVSANGAKALEGVRTDSEGRFSLSYASPDLAVAIVAYDEARAHAAFVSVDPARLAEVQSVTLSPTVPVTGEVSADGGKYYPAGCVCFVAPAGTRSFALRLEPVRGEYAVPLPPGKYVVNVQAPGRVTGSVDAVVGDAARGLVLGKLDLAKHEGRVQVGDLAPPIRVKLGDPALDATLVRQHFPDRWTLFYFWDFT